MGEMRQGSAEWERNHEIYNYQCTASQHAALSLMNQLWKELTEDAEAAEVAALAVSAIPTGVLIAAAQRLLDSAKPEDRKLVEDVACNVIRRVFNPDIIPLATMQTAGRA
jgi:CDP-diacylglycerol pyrophosphatase